MLLREFLRPLNPVVVHSACTRIGDPWPVPDARRPGGDRCGGEGPVGRLDPVSARRVRSPRTLGDLLDITERRAAHLRGETFQPPRLLVADQQAKFERFCEGDARVLRCGPTAPPLEFPRSPSFYR